ncbi:MAG: hydroxyacid dehydrogenase [Candidatus Moranbacteria bacterium]|nr:hydroxyacid dehydrogenase [Candidatus Moranbacteria bacterium]
MKIAFFETNQSDQDYLSRMLAGHELFFSTEPLTEKNSSQAGTYEIISVFIYSAINRAVIDKLKSVRLIATRSTGFDHIDAAFCQEKNITVSNVPHYGENTVAEHTFALILALSRNVHKSYARGLKEDFSIDGLMGFDLKDKTLGVIGTGHIGLHVIRIAKGFGMHVIAYDTYHDIFLSEILHYKYAPLDQVLSQSDIVTLHVPYNEHTHHLINRKNIKNIKKGALLINTARGGIVDNEALIEALDDHTLSGAGIDVLEGEELIKEENQCLRENCGGDAVRQNKQNRDLLSRDNVVFTPHIGFYSEEALRRILDTTLQNITRFTLGKIENPIVPS